MSSRRRFYGYILLNILVSACVVLAFIYVYDRYFRSSPPVTVPPLGTPSSGNQGGDALDIVSVVGAGVLETETLEIRNNGDGRGQSHRLEAANTGWKDIYLPRADPARRRFCESPQQEPEKILSWTCSGDSRARHGNRVNWPSCWTLRKTSRRCIGSHSGFNFRVICPARV